MPYCEVSLTKGALSESEKSSLAGQLTKILLDSEGLTDNPIARSIALVEFKAFDTLYIGGDTAGKSQIVIKLFAFANAFTNEAKNKFFSDITNAFVSTGKNFASQKGSNVWCILMPIQPFDFSVGGKPVSLEITRQLVNSYKV